MSHPFLSSPALAVGLTVKPLLRSVPTVMPFETASRAASLMAHFSATTLPVVDERGRLLGAVTSSRLRTLLKTGETPQAYLQPVVGLMEPAEVILSPESSVSEAAEKLAESLSGVAFITDRSGRFLGVVHWLDLMQPLPVQAPVPGAGGMATPFGVYLVAGTLKSGLTTRGLLLGGVVLGLMIAACYAAVGALCLTVDRMFGTSWLMLWAALHPPDAAGPAVMWLLLQGLVAVAFLFVLRTSSLTGYHGAEHQVVHALERGEPLVPEVVARMPRVHHRCGTNVMAAVAVFAGLMTIFAAVFPKGWDVVWLSAVAAAITLRTWRNVGAWLQEYVTTRPPSSKQLETAIAAGRALREKYVRHGGGHPSRWQYLWNTGVLPMAMGVAVGLVVPLALFNVVLIHMPQ